MAAKQGAAVESLLECPVCLGSFDDPRVLPCLHTLCMKCLQDHISTTAKDDKYVCPSCRHECRVPVGGASAVPKNFFINSLKEIVHQQPDGAAAAAAAASEPDQGETEKKECGNSKKVSTPHGEVTVFCKDCSRFYCETCESSHRAFDVFSDHELVPASEISVSAVQAAESKIVPRCEKHTELKMDIYCDTCQVEVGKESRDKLAELAQAAAELIDKLSKHLQELEASEDNIQRDFNKVCQEVHQAADAMRDLVTKREQYLIQQIQDSGKVALLEVRASHKNTELSKVSTQSLHSYMAALLEKDDVTNLVVHTPGLQEQLRQQQTTPLKSVTWTANFKEETQSISALDAMLGTARVDRGKTATTPLPGGGDKECVLVLGAPVLTRKPDVGDEVSGIAVVGDCVCATGWFQQYLWIHNIDKQTSKQHELGGLVAVGMTVHNNTLVITDKRKKLHSIAFDQHTLSITKHIVTDLPFEPRHVSLDVSTEKVIIANCSDKQVAVCDSTGNIESHIPVDTDVGFMRCAVGTDGGYAVLDYSAGRLHWVDMHGNATHMYGQQDGEDLRYPEHMVQDTQGRLVVADTDNHRLHLIGANRQLSHYLLTKDDGIQRPTCVCLDEATGRLFVGCGDYDQPELRVYKWPTTAPSTEGTHHTLRVTLGRYK